MRRISKLLKCPFCGGKDIGYSVKTTGRWERKYHVTMYCKDCNCYGKRVLITPTENTRYDVERSEEYKKLAINAWNTRTPMSNIVEKLEEAKEKVQDEMEECIFKGLPYHDSTEGKVIGITTSINIVKQEINNGLE